MKTAAKTGETMDARGPEFWQRVCDSTVPGIEREQLGEWWLRADAGETGRANSAWPAGDPQCSIGEAVDATQRWYVERHLTPMIQLYSTSDPTLRAELDRREWEVVRGADVLAVELDDVGLAQTDFAGDDQDVPDNTTLTVTPAPTPAFMELTANDARVEEMMRTPDRRWFVSVCGTGGQALGCGLAIRAEDSIGIFAMATAPEARRQGIARRTLMTLLDAGRADGAHMAFLQVMTSNVAAQGLYRSVGFRLVEHYEYRKPLDKSSEKSHSC